VLCVHRSREPENDKGKDRTSRGKANTATKLNHRRTEYREECWGRGESGAHGKKLENGKRHAREGEMIGSRLWY